MSTADPVITENAGLWGGRMFCFDAVDSTNSWATRNPGKCRHGDVIRAYEQTSGRGRFDREWISSRGRSLTLSLVIDSTRFPFLQKERLSQLAAVAAWQLLSGMEIQAQLKWPNDIMTSRGKISGILAEAIDDTRIVIGIGINASMEQHGDVHMTSIHAERNEIPCLDDLTGKLLASLAAVFADCADHGMSNLRKLWAAHDYLKDKDIKVSGAHGTVTGTYAGIDNDGRLLLKIDEETKSFSSGDVTLS